MDLILKFRSKNKTFAVWPYCGMSLEAKRTLIYAILKFLKDELKQDTITADFKESLEGN